MNVCILCMCLFVIILVWFETAFVLLYSIFICVHACAFTSVVSLTNIWYC